MYVHINAYDGFSFVAMSETRPLGACPLGYLWALSGPPFGLSMATPWGPQWALPWAPHMALNGISPGPSMGFPAGPQWASLWNPQWPPLGPEWPPLDPQGIETLEVGS